MKRKNANIQPDWILMAVAVCIIVLTVMHEACWIFGDFGMQKIQEWQTAKKSGENWKRCRREPF